MMTIFMIISKPTLSIFSKVFKETILYLIPIYMIQVPTAEPIADDPIVAIDTTNIVIVEPESVTVPVRVPPEQISIKETCKESCIFCGVCSLSLLTILCCLGLI